ncbi:MAG: shikimate kinase, partial [Chlamydiales bacterium]
MNLILCGFKGSGKTHFGRLLAVRVGLEFIDTDQLLEEKFHESCSLLARRVGRETFLSHEADVVTSLQNV